MVDQCAVCLKEDFYVREDTRKALGLVYLVVGLGAAYFTFGISLVAEVPASTGISVDTRS